MAASTNIHGFNIGGNNNSFDQRGHFYRAFLSGNVSGMLVKQNSTPNMTVLVEHGSALLNKNTISASVAEIKSDTSVTIDTANTSNPRIDTVVIYEDTSVAIPTVEANYWQDGAGGRFKIVSLPGTAGAVPVALSDANIQTAIGAGKPFARLADITVPTNSTTIINSNINNGVRSKLAITADKIDFTTFKKVGFLVYLTSDWTPASSGTNNMFSAGGTELFDIGNNVSSGTFTAPVTGMYTFSGTMYRDNTTDVTSSFKAVMSGTTRTFYVEQTASSANVKRTSGSIQLYLTAGDTVYFEVVYAAGAAFKGGVSNCWFTGALLTPA